MWKVPQEKSVITQSCQSWSRKYQRSCVPFMWARFRSSTGFKLMSKFYSYFWPNWVFEWGHGELTSQPCTPTPSQHECSHSGLELESALATVLHAPVPRWKQTRVPNENTQGMEWFGSTRGGHQPQGVTTPPLTEWNLGLARPIKDGFDFASNVADCHLS